jgi:N-methylhydantoinase B/oxoprolinase/acetone carboxylase alpha subunit
MDYQVAVDVGTFNDYLAATGMQHIQTGKVPTSHDAAQGVLEGIGVLAAGFGTAVVTNTIVVLSDVQNELVCPEAARRDYGVVLNRTSPEVDQERTEELRTK